MTRPPDDPTSATVAHAPGVLRALPGAVFMLLMMVGLATTLWATWRGHLDLFPQGVSIPTFMDGRVMQKMADSLSLAPLPAESAKLERGFSWRAIGDLGPRVRQGCPGWLFLADELRPYPHAGRDADARIQDVLAVKRELAQRKINLLVVVVPDKARIEAQQLCGVARPSSFAYRVKNWTAALAHAGIDTLDLTPVLAAVQADPQGMRAFLRTDTHWNETGAAVAAAEIARRVNSRGINVTPRVDYTTATTQAARPGDLVRLAGIDWLAPQHQPQPEVAANTVFKKRDAAQPGASPVAAGTPASAVQSTPSASAPSSSSGTSNDAADDLFGDDNLPTVALIGTSFSRTSNFVGFVERDLHTRIGNFAKDGGDFEGSARDYFGGPAFKETPPKLVIWEIPERVIQAPRDGLPVWTTSKKTSGAQ
ncbi:alginate O-acetyltransferase AlgX-related protein [Schauerella aestuarii]|uniref:alginate O-acetyltransferase AlgX-related protein n=1 Tax=Schauerella aestuarii TaxID=2511204 RepID=UPI00136EB88B|nr:cell division protein FtsQ [Achromobacter aestuarii]MYZ45829.1 cell division protein FtsQ [Achromobacter aestuarii]